MQPRVLKAATRVAGAIVGVSIALGGAELSAQPAAAAATGSDARAAAVDYETGIREAQAQLRASQPAAAEATLRTLLESHPTNTEVRGLLALTLESSGQLDEAVALYEALVLELPDDADLRRARDRATANRELAEARRLQAAGQLAAALELAWWVYVSGTATYDAGLLVAQIQSAQRLHIEAARTYGELARRYADDDDLTALQVRALVDAREREAAKALYTSLTPEAQAAATRALGGTRAGLYSSRLSLWGSAASSTAPHPDDQAQGLLLAQRIRRGTLTMLAEQHHRFGQEASQYGAGFEFPLTSPWGASVSFRASPDRNFLASKALSATINYWWPRSMAYLAVQSLEFTDSRATVLAPGATWFATERWTLDSRVYWVTETGGYALLIAPQWSDGRGNRARLTLVGGEASEDLGVSGGILRYPTQSARLDLTWRCAERWSLNLAFHTEHRSGLYDRKGAQLEIGRWW